MTIDHFRYSRACSLLLEKAVVSATSGATHKHFERWADIELGEAERRSKFSQLREALDASAPDAMEEALKLLKFVNGAYKTRFNLKLLGSVRDILITFAKDNPEQVPLLELNENEVVQRAKIITEVLGSIHKATGRQPYSLTTKFLHLLLPEIIVIHDSQSAKSIWMWSLFAIGGGEPEASEFSQTNLMKTDASGYLSMVRFYYRVWHSAEGTIRDRLSYAAKEIQKLLENRTGLSDAPVTVLDVIDKHLWFCDGDPILLGIANPPSQKTKR